MTVKYIELSPIREWTEDYEGIEQRIKELFKQEIYLPLIREIGLKRSVLKNSNDDLVEAIQTGRITFYNGVFRGPLNSTLTRQLKKIGAVWDKNRKLFTMPKAELPMEVRQAISVAEHQFDKALERIDKKLSEIVPAEIAGKLRVTDLFDKALFRVEKDFKASVKKISIEPSFTPDRIQRISEEYTHNLELYITDFTAKETAELRKRIQERTFEGIRYETLVEEIQASYGVSKNKAKFLARQETSLLTTKYAQTQYEAAGVNEYKWACVKMPHQPSLHAPYIKGEVRYHHGELEGKIYSWNNPPIVNEKGDRKNPGQDYNCRCFAIPVVKFTTQKAPKT